MSAQCGAAHCQVGEDARGGVAEVRARVQDAGMRRGPPASRPDPSHRAAADLVATRDGVEHRQSCKVVGKVALRWADIRGVSSKAGCMVPGLELTLPVPDSSALLFPRAAQAPAQKRSTRMRCQA